MCYNTRIDPDQVSWTQKVTFETISVFNLEYELNQGYGHMYIHQLSNNGKSPLQTYGIVC